MSPRTVARVRLDRGGSFAPCDACVLQGKSQPNRGTEVHHIINKGRTQKNPEARRRTEVLPLLSWLCRDCHTGSGNVHNPIMAAALLRFNAQMYGRETVEQALATVSATLSSPIDLEF